jgi:hypothetical protein
MTGGSQDGDLVSVVIQEDMKLDKLLPMLESILYLRNVSIVSDQDFQTLSEAQLCFQWEVFPNLNT